MSKTIKIVAVNELDQEDAFSICDLNDEQITKILTADDPLDAYIKVVLNFGMGPKNTRLHLESLSSWLDLHDVVGTSVLILEKL